MLIIGCDYHPSWQQICWVDTLTGETEEKKLDHASGEAERFYRQLPEPAVIGMESTGNCQWFVEMATTTGHEVWIGDAAKIRASEVRQQKHDRRRVAHPSSAGKRAPLGSGGAATLCAVCKGCVAMRQTLLPQPDVQCRAMPFAPHPSSVPF